MTETTPTIPTNRNAIFSIIAAILTLFSVCGAVVPIPFTGFVCYPTAVLFGLAALVAGINSLRQLRSSGENGRPYAIIGTAVGVMTALAILCVIGLAIAFLPQIILFIKQIPNQPPIPLPNL
ncbi:MAG TPA: DUF4190 domain-containing protein [Anaerolineales bacterium]|jgi:hypothetical protein|nr:DUF4190 domain-containing protein [Anaerolineales bacterium]